MLTFYDFIQVFVFTTNHQRKAHYINFSNANSGESFLRNDSNVEDMLTVTRK